MKKNISNIEVLQWTEVKRVVVDDKSTEVLIPWMLSGKGVLELAAFQE